ncbi:MAG: hypothetical protein JXA57_14705 [Armatimonadetes bacterium]|nr:hypothetical protein [Armatimonadota bacterium]
MKQGVREGSWLLVWLFVAASWSGSALMAATAPQVYVDGQATAVQAVRAEGDEVLVGARDLERIGIVSVRWNDETRSATLTAGDVSVAFRARTQTATVTVLARSGRSVSVEEPLAVPAELAKGRLLVPLLFVCEKLGVDVELPSPDVVRLRRRPAPPRRGSEKDPGEGTVVGRVSFNDLPLPEVRLRLVRASDSIFMVGFQARTDAAGRYVFRGVPAGKYRVYAYVGDNPDYFNRETATFTVGASGFVAPTIVMGRIIRPLRPRPHSRLPVAEQWHFAWTPCPGAASYEFSVTDPETHEEVVLKVIQTAEATVPGTTLTPGRRYQCRVLALNKKGDFVGATPGTGATPWVVTVVVADPGTAGDSSKGD